MEACPSWGRALIRSRGVGLDLHRGAVRPVHWLCSSIRVDAGLGINTVRPGSGSGSRIHPVKAKEGELEMRLLLVSILVAGVWSALLSGCGDEEEPAVEVGCRLNSDCALGEVCDAGICVVDEGGCG